MEFTRSRTEDGMLIALRGAFTFKDHHVFRSLLDALHGGGNGHVLDLSGLDFIDSAGLGMLLLADDEARGAGWQLTLRRPSAQVARLFEVAALDTIFRIEA